MLNLAEHPQIVKSAKSNPPVIAPPAQEEDLDTTRLRAWLAERINRAGVSSEIVTIVPKLAKILLERNTANRPVSQANLIRLKRDLSEGNWQFNGEAIILADSGELNDGQHRLLACVDTKKSFVSVVVFGAPRKSRDTLDQGVMRNVGQWLGMRGHPDPNNLAAIANNIWQYKNIGRLSKTGGDRPTKVEVILVLDHYKDAEDSLKFVSRAGVGTISTRSLIGFVHWVFARINKRGADEFIDMLIEGRNLNKGSPILYCRNRLIEMRGGSNANARAELMFRAWKLWRNGESVERIPILNGRLPELGK